MRQRAWDEVKIALMDYPKADWYVQQIRMSKLFPYNPIDENADISSGSFSPDGIVNKVISIQDDVTLNRIRYQQQVIKRRLKCSPCWLQEIIELMYFQDTKLKLTPACEIAGVDFRAGKKAYEAFMSELAGDLGILTF